jgi:pilus assembly protein CpaC
VPIPIAGDEGEITVDYKKFGVGLEFTPTVLADGLISLEIAPEVSSIDESASVSVGNGISVPGFVVRRAQTSVDLKNGQSFMMAGLLQTENNMINQAIPGLGKLPVLGPLFSSKSYQRRQTDLVIIVTPYLVKPIDPSKKPRLPTDESLPGSNVDFFLGTTEEVKVSDAGTPLTKPGMVAAQVGAGHILDLP